MKTVTLVFLEDGTSVAFQDAEICDYYRQQNEVTKRGNGKG
jgi:hypothetical protein